MERVTKLEAMAASWHQGLPHLPNEARRWLAENSWWMVLVAVIIGGLTVVGVLAPLLLAGVLFAGLGGIFGAAIGGLIVIFVLFWIGLTIVNTILLAMAVNPLKRREKRGWSLVFVVLLLNLAALALKVLFDFELGGFVLGLLGTAVAAYFLFEIREYFTLANEATIAEMKEADGAANDKATPAV